MRKILFGIMLLFIAIGVNATTNVDVKNVNIENVKVEVNEKIGYNEEINIKYSINPRDASNLNITWSVTGLKKGVTVEFVSDKVTKNSDGEIKLKVNNTTNEEVTLSLIGEQDGKIVNQTKLNVQNKENTLTRVTEEVKNLILKLDEKINNNNYETNKELIEKIQDLLDNNPEIKDSIDEELLTKFEDVKTSVNDYDIDNNKTFVKIVSIVLVVVFSALIFWIFKKEEK